MGKEISLEEMKKIELDILITIDEICTKNNLKYSLMDGTLIGMVRHQGFIPWDDDIDIMMPRPDYEKLKNIFTKEPIDGLKYMSNDIQEDYYYPFAKVVSTSTTIKEYKSLEIKDYGVFVDIFPIDGVPNSKIKRLIQFKSLKILRILLQISFHEEQISKSTIKGAIKDVIGKFTQLIGFKKLNKIINRIMKKYEYTNSEYVTLQYSGISTKLNRYYKKEILDNVSRRIFENKYFWALDNYDRYLKDLYGDYMKLPPKEEQTSNHEFDRLEWK